MVCLTCLATQVFFIYLCGLIYFMYFMYFIWIINIIKFINFHSNNILKKYMTSIVTSVKNYEKCYMVEHVMTCVKKVIACSMMLNLHPYLVNN